MVAQFQILRPRALGYSIPSEEGGLDEGSGGHQVRARLA